MLGDAMRQGTAPGYHRTARVRVPATSANLGPGFDSLGLALAWSDEFTAWTTGEGFSIDFTGEGAKTIPRGENNLVLRGMRAGLTSLGADLQGAKVSGHNTIPSARGLGSSSAAIVAGLALAWALSRNGPVDKEWAFQLAVDLEGHPDNVGPAIYGGLTIGWKDAQQGWRLAPVPVDADTQVTVLVPGAGLETSRARQVMPDAIPLPDAIANSARTALLVRAFTGQPELLFEATCDFLHQEHRRDLYPHSLALVDHLRDQGLAACISGAGPTVAVFHPTDQAALVRLAVEGAQTRLASLPHFRVLDLGVGQGAEVLSR